MAEILMAIALLCQVPSGGTGLDAVHRHQLICQRDYLKCLKGTPSNKLAPALAECVLERKL